MIQKITASSVDVSFDKTFYTLVADMRSRVNLIYKIINKVYAFIIFNEGSYVTLSSFSITMQSP